jgi:co-chaperonin GroES (HSP10)
MYGRRIIVARDKSAAKQGGIIIAESAREFLNTGTVLYAGDESKFQPGQRILFHPLEPLALTFNGQEVWLMEDDAVIFVIMGEAA